METNENVNQMEKKEVQSSELRGNDIINLHDRQESTHQRQL